MKRTGPTNPRLVKMINELEKISRLNKAPIWKAVAEKLRKPTRSRIEVNLWKVNKFYRDGVSAYIIPGKLLGEGEIDKPVTVAAAFVSKSAAEKIKKAGGRVLLLDEYAKENPKGSNTVILG